MKIKQFFQSINHQYPELTYRQIENICLSPFKYVRFIFDEGTLDDIQIKHLGKFRVLPARIKAIKHKMTNTSYGELCDPDKRDYLIKKIKEYELQHRQSE